MSEDIDIIIEKLDFSEFLRLWNALSKDFWCIITSKPEDAYNTYLANQTAIRFALEDQVIPNIELKFPKTSVDEWVLNNAITANVGGRNASSLRSSPSLCLGHITGGYLVQAFSPHPNRLR